MKPTTAQRFGSLGKSFASPSAAAAVIGAALLASGTTDEAETAWSPAAACLLPDVLPVAGTLLSYGGNRQLAAGGTVSHDGALSIGANALTCGAITASGNASIASGVAGGSISAIGTGGGIQGYSHASIPTLFSGKQVFTHSWGIANVWGSLPNNIDISITGDTSGISFASTFTPALKWWTGAYGITSIDLRQRRSAAKTMTIDDGAAGPITFEINGTIVGTSSLSLGGSATLQHNSGWLQTNVGVAVNGFGSSSLGVGGLNGFPSGIAAGSIQIESSSAIGFSDTVWFETKSAISDRPSTGIWRIRANNGLQVKNLAGSAAAPITCGAITASGAIVNSSAGASSTPAMQYSGSVFTGGSGTTTLPFWLIQATGTTASTTWLTEGTLLGFNTPSGFAGRVIDLRNNGGATRFLVDSAGGIFGNNVAIAGTWPAVKHYHNSSGSCVTNDCFIGFSSGTTNATSEPDSRFSRNTAGVIQVGTTANNASGSLLLTNLTASGAIQETPTQSSLNPTTTDIPSGKRMGWYNSTLSEFRDWVNIGGTLLKSAAYT